MGFIKEFKEFAVKGNVLDLAVAVVLGGAFGKIVTALTNSFIMPVISMIMGKKSVSALFFMIGPTKFPVGEFLQAVIDFILVAFVLFMIIKAMNRLKRKEEIIAPVTPEPTTSEKLLMEIRDSLKK